MSFVPSTPTQPKLPKGMFKCFQCRQVYMQKDGDWHHWDNIQVHLCKGCEKETKDRPERKSR